MLPLARHEGLTLHPSATGLVVRDERSGAVHQLSPLSAAVFRAADGSASVDAIVVRVRETQPDADVKLVWSALDELGAAGLMQTAAAPLAAPIVDRRTMLRSMLVAPVAAAAFALPAVALAKAEEKRKDAPAEEMRKEMNAKQRVDAKREDACKADLRQRSEASQKSQQKLGGNARLEERKKKEHREQDMKKSYGLDSGDGDWRTEMELEFKDGAVLEGLVDRYSFDDSAAQDQAGNPVCGVTFDLHLDALGDPKTSLREKAATTTGYISTAVVGSIGGVAVLMGRLVSVSTSWTAFDAKMNPVRGTFHLCFENELG